MRVKRLEIQGFKSFKDKTVVHFDQGITGIVGPNGCGKSNIVDAFFWVMGEQSYKHIRGTSSDDLIFNGSSKYSPLGMAEATLVLETDEVDTANAPSGASAADIPGPILRKKEISVTRRVYRSGEGEYFINGQPARLKDIHELFMDTGIGAKGYSVIEQGQIGKIVNSKPEERRLLIEEAAGIAKYKARKRESLRKLEAAEANLARLGDVIAEIERSMNSLDRQAQKARTYQRLKGELTGLEMVWGRRKHALLTKRAAELAAERQVLEQEIATLRAELAGAEANLEVDRIAQLSDQKGVEDLQNVIQHLSDELTRERSALDLAQRRQGDLDAQLAGLAQEHVAVEAALQGEGARLIELTQESELSSAQVADASQVAARATESQQQARSELNQVRDRLDAAKRTLMREVSEASQLTSRVATLVARAAALAEQAARIDETLAADQAQESTFAAELAQMSERLASLETDVQKLRDERQSAIASREDKRKALKSQEAAHAEVQQRRTELESRLQSLQELDRAREGFGDGSRAVLEWAQNQPETGSNLGGVAIADLLSVQSGYEPAVEGWLDERVEHLLSRKVSGALDAINYLRSDAKGRVSIFCSDSGTGIAGTHAAQADQLQAIEELTAFLKESGFAVEGRLSSVAGVAADVSATHGVRVAEFVGNLLSHVLLVTSFEPLRTADFKDLTRRLAISGMSLVSLEGTVLDSTGVLRAGKQDDDAMTVLKTKRRIAELEAQVAEVVIEAEQSALQLEAARLALTEVDATVEGATTRLQSLEVEKATLAGESAARSKALDRIRSQIAHQERERTQAVSQRENIESERDTAQATLTEITDRRASSEAAIAEDERIFAEAEGALAAAEEALQAARIADAQVRERASSIGRELDSVRSMVAERERRLEELERLRTRAASEREALGGAEGNAELEMKIQASAEQLTARREELSALKDRAEQTSSRLTSGMNRIKELHHHGDQKTAQANQIAVQVSGLEAEHQHLVQNLEEKYGPGCLTQPPVNPEQQEFEDPIVTTEMSAEEEAELSLNVEHLRERIRKLGEVNVSAVEEYEEVKKRFDHITGERADLELSIRNLNEAIEYINRTSEDRFQKAFDAIAERFERLFPIIFGGGQAKLSLVMPEGVTDVLEAGVDILAQPPGKKILNITALSGGEKALTAISLIFAIFMVKPSPFCLLDEVDAPLDDANIGKFNALLREMSAKSQFIVITHNKKTMELNDALFGVTMEEPGVSKMVSIQLT